MSSNNSDNPTNPANHPDFALPWTQRLLQDSNTRIQHPTSSPFLSETLATPTAIPVQLFLLHHTPTRTEDIHLLSLQPGIDGAPSRAHGGLNALLLDHILGTCAARLGGFPDPPPATAYLNVQYKAPVKTPCVVMVRAWKERVEGRKVFVGGSLEGEGVVYATAEGLFVLPRGGAKAVL